MLGPVLLPLGYKRHGTRFIQQENGLDYSVYLERSSSNRLTDRPKQLSVFAEVFRDKKLFFSISLFRLTQKKVPQLLWAFLF